MGTTVSASSSAQHMAPTTTGKRANRNLGTKSKDGTAKVYSGNNIGWEAWIGRHDEHIERALVTTPASQGDDQFVLLSSFFWKGLALHTTLSGNE